MKDEATELKTECVRVVDNIEKELDTAITEGVASSVSLTNYALKLHDRLEKHTNSLVNLFNCEDSDEPECLALKSIRTTLPDLVVATILWMKRSTQKELLKQIRINLEDLKNNINRVKKVKALKEKFIPYAKGLATTIEEWKESLVRENKRKKSCCRDRDRETLLKTREFLSQQIDERSHQMWTLGSLFVPISFLIFAYSVTTYGAPVFQSGSGTIFYPFPDLLGKLLLMVVSLTCYCTWFFVYLRTNRLNRLSYPLIHGLELVLGLHGHLSLNEFRKLNLLLKMSREFFLVALNILIGLWIMIMSSSLLPSSMTNNLPFVSLLSMSIIVVTNVILSAVVRQGYVIPLASILASILIPVTILLSLISGLSDPILLTFQVLVIGLFVVMVAITLGLSVMLAKPIACTLRDHIRLVCLNHDKKAAIMNRHTVETENR